MVESRKSRKSLEVLLEVHGSLEVQSPAAVPSPDHNVNCVTVFLFVKLSRPERAQFS